MTKIKKAAVILAVMFVAGVGAGFAMYHYFADVIPAQILEYKNERN